MIDYMRYAEFSDDDLDIEIARRRGWTIERRGLGGIQKDYQLWRIQDADGEELATVATVLNGTEERAWVRFFEEELEVSPATDLNAAAELLKESKSTLSWTGYFGGEWRVQGNYINSAGDYNSAARGVAEDYLLYTDQFPTPAMLAAGAPLPVDADDSDGGWMDGLD